MKLPKPIADLLHGNSRDKLVIAGAVASVGAIAFLARGGIGGAASAAKSANPQDAAQLALGPSTPSQTSKPSMYVSGLPAVIAPLAPAPAAPQPVSNPGVFTSAAAAPASAAPANTAVTRGPSTAREVLALGPLPSTFTVVAPAPGFNIPAGAVVQFVGNVPISLSNAAVAAGKPLPTN